VESAIVIVVEVMIRDNFTTHNPYLKELAKFELMILIILENTSFLNKMDELRSLQVTYI
jgi:hypothetical protein